MTRTAKPDMSLECTCTPDTRPGCYAVGCPRHTDLESRRPPSGTIRAEYHTVTYFHAQVKIITPVLKDGVVWAQEEHVQCEHNHTDPASAERCASKLRHRELKRRTA